MSNRRPDKMEFDHFTYSCGNVDIFRKVGSNWVPWAMVRDSVAVPRGGKGLFAARPFEKDECVGRYTGHIMGRRTDPNVARRVERLSHTVQGDAIVTIGGFEVDGRRPVQSNAEQEHLCDRILFKQPNWSWPGVYAHIANDSRGTGMRNNARLTGGGFLEAKRRIPGYNFTEPHANNVASEILWSYGNNFWKDAAKLGSANMPYLINN